MTAPLAELTLEDVAARLRTSTRTLRRRLNEHPEVRPIRNGRSILFDELAYARLKEAALGS